MTESAATTAAGWSHFPHGADIGVRGRGPTPAAAFEQAALALTAIAVDPATLAPTRTESFACEAPDLELLLVDWLNALITRGAVARLLFGRFHVTIEPAADGGWRLRGEAAGEAIDRGRHEVAVEAKGATMTGLAVRAEDDGSWVAECVIDV